MCCPFLLGTSSHPQCKGAKKASDGARSALEYDTSQKQSADLTLLQLVLNDRVGNSYIVRNCCLFKGRKSLAQHIFVNMINYFWHIFYVLKAALFLHNLLGEQMQHHFWVMVLEKAFSSSMSKNYIMRGKKSGLVKFSLREIKLRLRHWLHLQATQATPPIDCLACPCSEFLLV